MAGAFGYLMISGAAFATVRSYIMISIMFLAVMLDRPAVALRNVALAALAILLVWPESLFDPGFQMSFAAVVALVSVYEWLRGRAAENGVITGRGALRDALSFFGGIVASTLIASLAVAPFGIYHFHNTQQFAILANLIAIPDLQHRRHAGRAGDAGWRCRSGLEAVPLWVMGWGIEAMVWCANLGGRTARSGGTRAGHSRLGVRPDGRRRTVVRAVAHALAAARSRADRARLDAGAHGPEAGRDRRADPARLVAVRTAAGELSALAGRGSSFELARWLEHDGDGRPQAEASQGRGVPLRPAGLHRAREGHAVGGRQFTGGTA